MQQTKAIVINELCPSLSSPIGAIGGLDFGVLGVLLFVLVVLVFILVWEVLVVLVVMGMFLV